jgi:hypothetical protein
MAPLTAQTDSEVADSVIDNLNEFRHFEWSDFVQGRIHTTADLTKRDVDEQAKPVIDALSDILHSSFLRKELPTADSAMKALFALLLSSTHVSTNITVQSESSSFQTPSPANVARTSRLAIQAFRKGEGHTLFREHLEASRRARTLGNLVEEDNRKIQAAITAISHGHISKGKRTLTSHGLAKANEQTLHDIQDTYYPKPTAQIRDSLEALIPSITNIININPNEPPYEFTMDEMEDAIKALPEETAADSIGIRPGHIKKLLSLGHANLVNLICTNYFRRNMSKEAMAILRGGLIIPLIKDPIRNTKRPIAITGIIAKITDQIILKRHGKPTASGLTEPIQYGVGNSMASEKVALLTRAALYRNPQHGIVQYDLKNAYGLIARSLILRALIAEGNKDLIRAFYTRYYGRITLWMHMESGEIKQVEVDTGLLQGDSLAPLFFSMGFHIILRRLYNNEGRDCTLMAAFIDDLSAGGELDTLSTMTKRFQPILEEEQSGLEVNWGKTLIFCPTTHANTIAHPPPWRVMGPDQGIKVLGAYIGAPDWVRSSLAEDAKKMADDLVSVRRLPTQHALLVLRLCIVHQFNFTQRHTPPSLYGALAGNIHDLIWNTLRDLLDIPDRNVNGDLIKARQRAELPMRHGGLGLLNSVHTKFEAFLAGIGDVIMDLSETHPVLYNFLANEMLLKPYAANDPANKNIDRDHFHADIHKSVTKVKSNITAGCTAGILQTMSDTDIEKMYPSTATQLLQPHSKLQKRFANLEQDLFYRRFFGDLDDQPAP